MYFPPLESVSFIAEVWDTNTVCSAFLIRGCNFRCPYCINRKLIENGEGKMHIQSMINLLWARKEKIILLSGGEPLSHDNIFNLCEEIKKRGMVVAIATNGSFPKKIKDGFDNGLIDHVIMDIKTDLNKSKYEKVIGRKLTVKQFDNILRSIEILSESKFDGTSSEFRTTVCSKFVSKEDVFSIARYLGGNAIYVLQPYTIHQTLDPDLAKEEYIVPFETLEQWSNELRPFVYSCIVREV